jgi:hypothetical protein
MISEIQGVLLITFDRSLRIVPAGVFPAVPKKRERPWLNESWTLVEQPFPEVCSHEPYVLICITGMARTG